MPDNMYESRPVLPADLNALFTDPARARAALEAIRWPDRPVCPHCGSTERIASGHGRSHRAGLYRCGKCARQFSVTVQTLLEGSKIPLNSWWRAAYMFASSSNNVSVNHIRREVGVTYKTAWFMTQRVRAVMSGSQTASVGEAFAGVLAEGSASSKGASREKPRLSAETLRAARIMSALLAHDQGPANSRGPGKPQSLRGGAKRSRDPRSTREAILAVSAIRLAKDGHEGLSLTEVAQIAGVNRGTAYHHFKTRKKLIEATTDYVSEMLYRAVYGDPNQARERAVEKLDVPGINDRLASFALKNPELCRAWLLQVLASPHPGNDMFWREYQDSNERWCASKFAQPNVDHEVTTVLTLAGVFLWPVWVQAHYKGKQSQDELARRFTNELLRLSMFGSLRVEMYPDIVKRLRGSGGRSGGR
jgi:AcrR family transcriptional regulator/transposase-like protein